MKASVLNQITAMSVFTLTWQMRSAESDFSAFIVDDSVSIKPIKNSRFSGIAKQKRLAKKMRNRNKGK